MNDNFWQLLIAVLGGSGVWELIKFEVEKHKKKLSDEQKLMLGIAHDRIWSLGGQYLRRKGITKSELDNLERIAVPYLSSGGNGTGEKIWNDVKELELISESEAERLDAEYWRSKKLIRSGKNE